MPLPKVDYTGQIANISMTELRDSPGKVFDLVSCGLVVNVYKKNKLVGIINPPDTEIKSDGTIIGSMPLTYKRNL